MFPEAYAFLPKLETTDVDFFNVIMVHHVRTCSPAIVTNQ